MKSVLKSALILAVVCVGLSCRKEAVPAASLPQDNPEPRWMVIRPKFDLELYEERCEIDVADWEIDRDVIFFVYHPPHSAFPYLMPYFWQGEDTIEYFCDFDGEYLEVNGKVIGISYLSVLDSHPRANPDSILACEARYGTEVEVFREYLPNLRAVSILHTSCMESWPWLSSIVSIWDYKAIPEDIDIYLYSVGITNFELWKLTLIPNLKGLVATMTGKLPRGFENLEKLALSVSDKVDLRNVGRIKNLKVLELSGKGIDDTELEYISNLENLRVLKLESTSITDSGLSYLEGLLSLRKLELSDCGLTDQGLKHIGMLEGLRELSLEENQVTDAGLRYLADLRDLHKLDLSENHITDQGLEYLSRLSRLEMLDLSVTDTSYHYGITDVGLKHITELKDLRELYLDGHPITDAGLEYLKYLPRLRKLGNRGTEITYEKSSKLLPNCETGFVLELRRWEKYGFRKMDIY